MRVSSGKSLGFKAPDVLTQFWEAWVLALVLVTILAFFGKSHPRPMLTKSDYNRSQFDPLEIQSEAPGKQGRPLESGF